ncbi:MAG: hypothetical protein QM601_13750 [Pseudoxanthomonas sp.]
MRTISFTSLALAMLAGVLALAACQRTSPALEQARARIAAKLPQPYFEDLVTESVSVSGKRLVLQVRSPAGSADATRKDPRFDALRQSEQNQLRELCRQAEIKPLLGSDAILVRRFLDRKDRLFFEVSMPVSQCPPLASTERAR